MELSKDCLRKCIEDTSKLFDTQVFIVKKGKVRDFHLANTLFNLDRRNECDRQCLKRPN